MDYRDLSDKDLFDLFAKADVAEKLMNQEEWKILKEASERIAERAIKRLATITKADNIVEIIELQTIIKKYRYGLFSEVEQLKTEAEFIESQVVEEIEDREITNSQSPA